MGTFTNTLQEAFESIRAEVGEDITIFGSSFSVIMGGNRLNRQLTEAGVEEGIEVETDIPTAILGTNVLVEGITGTYSGNVMHAIEIIEAEDRLHTRVIWRK